MKHPNGMCVSWNQIEKNKKQYNKLWKTCSALECNICTIKHIKCSKQTMKIKNTNKCEKQWNKLAIL